MTTLSEVMTPDPIVIAASATVREALELLESAPIRHLPVISDGTLVGVLSDRDVRPWRQALWDSYEGEASAAGTAALAQPVSGLMSTDVVFLAPERPITDAVDVMLDFQVGAVPVVQDGTPVGIVSYVDLLELLNTLLKD